MNVASKIFDVSSLFIFLISIYFNNNVRHLNQIKKTNDCFIVLSQETLSTTNSTVFSFFSINYSRDKAAVNLSADNEQVRFFSGFLGHDIDTFVFRVSAVI